MHKFKNAVNMQTFARNDVDATSIAMAKLPHETVYDGRLGRFGCKFLILPHFKNGCDLRGCYTPNQKLACFVLYLKIIITFLKSNIFI